MTTIVHKTHNRQPEPYNAQKLQNTIYAACLNVREPEKSARQLAQKVVKEVEEWLQTKPQVTSLDIREKASSVLELYHPEAAYIYKQYSATI